jgi:hypothetical protein
MAGPAGDWQRSVEGRLVSVESGRPLLQLDDLVVVLRQLRSSVGATFGCSITPSRDNLALTQQFLDASRGTPLKSGARDAWLGELRTKLGRQNIEVFGIDPRTRAAQVMVEADYRMKLIGMGLEEGVLGVDSYLDSISLKPGESPPPLDVLRWWFAMNYAAIQCTPNRQAFELHGQGVRVLCENELLDAGGERIHTGEATALNHLFAQNFTEHFAKLAVKYPVYAELQNVFDLALALALIRAEGLADLANWQAPCFIGDNTYRVATRRAPQTVETVMNHRVINKRHIIVGVSGGVRVDPWQLVKNVATESDNYGKLNDAHKAGSAPADTQPDRWWWD